MIERQPSTQYVASISRGKDSNAMLHVIKDVLHYPLDRIVTVQVWATQDIPAELPPVVAWQDECDKRILDMFGVPVERLCAKDKDGNKISYNDIFYRTITHKRERERGSCIMDMAKAQTYGFPWRQGSWCKKLKMDYVPSISTDTQCAAGTGVNPCSSNVQSTEFSSKPREQGAKINTVQYIGIAADEPERIKRHEGRKGIVMPLVDAGWTEKMCYEWCADNGLLAPTYTTSMRDGCWFCHNQGVAQLRNLRHNYPELWKLLLQWDTDSPVSFHADGHTVHDFDMRFQLEDDGYINPCERFNWGMLDAQQISMDMILKEVSE